MRVLSRFVILFLLVGAALGQSLTPVNEWHRIGLKKVGVNLKTESFSVDKDAGFRLIRLRVWDAGILVEDWVLEYRDGTTQHAGFLGAAPAGRPYPPLQVRPGLKKIRFKYRALESGRKAKVEIQGHK